MPRPVILDRRQTIAKYPGMCIACGNDYSAGRVVTLAGLSWAHPRCEPAYLEHKLAEVHADLAAFEQSLAGKNTVQLDRIMTWLVDRGLSFEGQLVLERAFTTTTRREHESY